MTIRVGFRQIASLLSLLTTGACIPYTVGSTAQPAPTGQTDVTFTTSVLPNGMAIFDSTRAYSWIAFDFEARYGLDDGASDVGLRIPSASGIIFNYKRRLVGDRHAERPAIAMMMGGGIVNFGNHLHLEGSLIASGRENGSITPYGGVRFMQVAPLSDSAVTDSPTAGGFFGVRFGTRDFGISPEIGIYYDRSALGVRRKNYVIIPAFSIHGKELLELIGDLLPGR
jgi:hypothetical protein